MSFLFIENAKKAWERIGAGFLYGGKSIKCLTLDTVIFKIDLKYLLLLLLLLLSRFSRVRLCATP